MPLPSPFLFPSPFLLPGGPGPFSEIVLNAVSPWADASGFWNTYNASIATMFEPVYDIVADQGDAAQTIIGTLSAPLTAGTTITEIPVQAVSQSVDGGTEITVSFGENYQIFQMSFSSNPGDGVILIDVDTVKDDYPIGSPVQLAFSPGWSSLLDPEHCPDQFLPFLAQFNGTDVPVGLDPTTARVKISGESALHRGTTDAIVSAVRRNLSGSQSVFIEERTNNLGATDSYWFIVIVRPEEVVSVTALTADVNNTKPGGVQWTLVQTDAWTISQMEASQPSITALEGNFATITGLEQDRPGT